MKTHLTIIFNDGQNECTDVTDYLKFHELRHDEPVDWEYFIGEELEYDMNTVKEFYLK